MHVRPPWLCKVLSLPPPPIANDLSFLASFKRILERICFLNKADAFSYSSIDFQKKVSAGCFDHIHSCAFPFLGVRFALTGAVCLDHIHFRALLIKMKAYKRLLWSNPKILWRNPNKSDLCIFNDKFINKKGLKK